MKAVAPALEMKGGAPVIESRATKCRALIDAIELHGCEESSHERHAPIISGYLRPTVIHPIANVTFEPIARAREAT
jgi:hypothetical protein